MNPFSGTARRGAGFVLGLTMAWSGCGGERNVSGPTSPPPGGPSFATLIVHAGIHEADADLAAALGWEAGVPGAAVSLLRLGTGEWETRTTDAGGEARYEGLLPGEYLVYVGRQLEADEAADAGLAVRTFGDGETVGIATAGTVRHDFELAADVTGSLVISEVSQYSPPPWETGGGYAEAHFVEVYNNGGATVFLDGKVLGATFWTGESVFGNCALTEEARLDPLGIYSAQMLAFPGGGNEHPVAPGETRVVAVSAIDHTPVHPTLFDLSSSEFEMVGGAGADNPGVPNMVDVGLEPFVVEFVGTSLVPLNPRRAVFLAEPVDPHALPILFRDVNGKGFVRIPAERLIDVTGLALIWPERDREFPPCHPMLDPAFDRYEGGFLSIALGVEDPRVSYQRRILRVDGYPILQDTNTSAVDFVLQAPSPGVLPN